MDAAQPPQHEAMEARIAVVLSVGVKIGVKTRGHGNAERARRSDRRGAERPLGDDVNQVGALRTPLAKERPAGGQTEAEHRVAGHGEPEERELVEVGVSGAGHEIGAARPIDRDGVSATTELASNDSKGHRHAIDLWRECFGDDG